MKNDTITQYVIRYDMYAVIKPRYNLNAHITHTPFLSFAKSTTTCVFIMEYGSTPYVGMAWEKNGVHI